MGIMEKLLKNTAADPDSLFDRGEVLCRQGYYADAIDLLEKVQAAEPGRARASQLKGYALYQLGSFEEALQYFDRALGIDPDLPDALVYKGLIYSNLGKHSLALDLYDRALAIHPTFVQAWYAKGLTLAIQEKYDASILAYEQVLSLDPRHMDALIGISVARKKTKETGRPEPSLLKHPKEHLPEKSGRTPPGPIVQPLPVADTPSSLIRTAPELPALKQDSVKNQKGHVGAEQVARIIIERAIPVRPVQSDPPEVSVPPGIFPEKEQPASEPVPASAAPRCSTYEELIVEIDRHPEKVPVPDRWYILGNLYSKTGKFKDAAAMFERYAETNPGNPDAWRALGDVRKKAGLYDESLSAYDRSLELDPANIGVWINRAKTLVMLEEYEEALTSCNKAIALDAASVDAWIYKGFILKKTQRDTEAIAAYDQVLAINPGHVQIARERERIKRGA